MKSFIDVSGILSALPHTESELLASYETLFSDARSALDAAGPELTAALAAADKRQSLSDAADALASLRTLFQMQIAPALGLTPGFNSLDGD